MGRSALRTIDAQITRRLIHFVLHQIEGRDLDERVDDTGRFGSRLEAMPGMRTPAGIRTRRGFRHDELWEVTSVEGRVDCTRERTRYSCAAHDVLQEDRVPMGG